MVWRNKHRQSWCVFFIIHHKLAPWTGVGSVVTALAPVLDCVPGHFITQLVLLQANDLNTGNYACSVTACMAIHSTPFQLTLSNISQIVALGWWMETTIVWPEITMLCRCAMTTSAERLSKPTGKIRQASARKQQVTLHFVATMSLDRTGQAVTWKLGSLTVARLLIWIHERVTTMLKVVDQRSEVCPLRLGDSGSCFLHIHTCSRYWIWWGNQALQQWIMRVVGHCSIVTRFKWWLQVFFPCSKDMQF